MMSNAPKTPLLATADTRILGPWRVRVGFTSREAGNLGLHVDDELGGGMDASMVRTLNHRAALEEALGAGPFFYLNQVHGVEVARPEDYAPASYAPGTPAERTVERARAIAKLAPVADAAVSVEGRPLAIMVADCIPVVLVGSVEGEKTCARFGGGSRGPPRPAGRGTAGHRGAHAGAGRCAHHRVAGPQHLRCLLRGARGDASRIDRADPAGSLGDGREHPGSGPAGRRSRGAGGRRSGGIHGVRPLHVRGTERVLAPRVYESRREARAYRGFGVG